MFKKALLCVGFVGALCANAPSYETGLSYYGKPNLTGKFAHLPQANPKAVKGGQLKVGVTGTFDSIFPFPIKGIPCLGNGITDEAMVYDKLMFRQTAESFTQYAWLAEGVMVDPEHKWIEFKLNPKAKWADGKPVTTADVEFSIQALKEQGRPIFKNVLKNVEKIEIKSEHVIRVHLSPLPHPLNPNEKIYGREPAMLVGNMPVLPKHLLEGKKFEDIAQDKIMGSGPYEIVDIKMGSSVTYGRRKNYWGANIPVNVGRFNFDTIKFVYFRDANVMFEALKAGDIDLMVEDDAKRRKSGYVFDRFKSKEVVLSTLTGSDTVGLNGFIMNTRKPLFENKDLRKALVLAMDFDWMNHNLFDNKYKRALSYFGKAPYIAEGAITADERKIWGDTALPEDIQDGTLPVVSIAKREQRRKEVLDLLKKAGYEVRSGKCINIKTNTPLTIDLMVENNDAQKESIAYARQLKQDYGIALNVRKLDTAQFWNRAMKFDFEMVSLKWSGMASPGVEQRNRWTTESAGRDGSLNWAGVRDQNVDNAINHLLVAKTQEEQVAATRVIDRLLRWGYYIVPLGYDSMRYVLHTARLRYPQNETAKKIVVEKSFWWAEAAH